VFWKSLNGSTNVVMRAKRSWSAVARAKTPTLTIELTSTKNRIGAPTTHNMPIRMANRIRAVPRSRPKITRPVASSMPGTTGTMIWCRLVRRRSLLA